MERIRYRRRSNWFGWLMFFVIGGAVFAGLVIALQFFKVEQEKRDQQEEERRAQQQEKAKDPIKIIRERLADDYKKRGEGYRIVGMGEVKKVQSKLAPREFTMVRVQHRAASKD